MSVYVDPLFTVDPNTVKNSQARRLTQKYGKWSHLMTDGDDKELFCFAAHLGMQLKWIQNAGTAKAHFDLVPPRREAAVRMGAIEISREEMLMLIALRSASLYVAQGQPRIAIDFKSSLKGKPSTLSQDLFDSTKTKE